ncbi:gap junction gamma-1 protein-like [Arapaima gigas]
MISTPTIMYVGFAVHKIARMESEEYHQRERRKVPFNRRAIRNYEEVEDCEADPMVSEEIEPEKKKGEEEKKKKKTEETGKRHDGRRRIKRDGLMKVYVIQLLTRLIFEVGFFVGQYKLYGFTVDPKYVCNTSPCPHNVDCFVSRPTEKTVFLYIMYGVSALCLMLTVLEILHLGVSGIAETFCKGRAQRPLQTSYQLQRSRLNASAPLGYHMASTQAPGKKLLLNGNFKDGLRDSGRESLLDEASLRDLEHLRRQLRVAQQRLDMVQQQNEGSPTCSSLESNGATASEQNRINFAQEKLVPSEKGIQI